MQTLYHVFTSVPSLSDRSEFIQFCVTHMLRHVGVGQAVQAEDVAVLSVLVDLGETQFCGSHHRGICARPLLQPFLFHWCGVDALTPERQQQ